MRPKPDLSLRDETPAGVVDSEYYVLGGEHVGVFVARRLRAAGHTVSVVGSSRTPEEIPALEGDPTDVRTLNEAGLSDASVVVVATSNDGRNLLIAQLVRANFEISRVIVLVSVPSRLELVAEAGHEPVCATTALSGALFDTI